MERLTKYLASGAADYNYPAGCYSGNDCNDRVAKSAYRQTCVERLAAYEETGLTPEEINDLASVREISPEAEYAINKHAGTIIERLDKLLAQTDDDDRMA